MSDRIGTSSRAVDDPVLLRAEARVLGEARPVERGGEAAEQIVVAGRHHHVAVRRGEGLVRHDHVDAGAVPRRQFAGSRDSRRDRCSSRRARSRSSEVSTMPPLPVRPRSCNAARMPITDHIAGAHVDDRGGDPDRRPAVLARAGSSARYRPASSGRSRAGRAAARSRRTRRDCSTPGSALRRPARRAPSPYWSSAPNFRLWITTSARSRISARSRAASSGSARSIVMPRLARLTA